MVFQKGFVKDMDLSNRKREILKIVVEQFVLTTEPVGSKAVSEELGSAISSATIRNEMAELESMGLLEQPHTSAGRVPSAQGYRMYVDELMHHYKLSSDDTNEIDKALISRANAQTQLIDEAGYVASRLTRYPAYAMTSTTGIVSIARLDFIYVDTYTFIIVALLSNDTVKNKLVHLTTTINQAILIKLGTVFNASFTGIPEEQITTALITSTERALGDTTGIVAVIAGFIIELLCEAKAGQARVAGAMNLLNHPEYRDFDKASRLIQYLSDADDKELFKLPSPSTSGEIKITIGPENLAQELQDSSVLAIRYNVGDDMEGLIGIIGPTRMEYSKVAARLTYIAQGLSLLLSGSEIPKIAKLGVDDIGHE